MKNILARVLDLVLPRHCLGCQRAGDYLCDACLERLPSAPSEDAGRGQELVSALDYHHPQTKQAIWLFKYRGGGQLAKKFAQRLYPQVLESLAETSLMERLPWLLAPIPLTPQREKRRGFNQAALLAEALAQHDPQQLVPAPRLLSKIRATPHQASLKSRERRLANTRGIFAVTQPALVNGRSIIVVDDVVTTGATTSEARRVLLAAGAKNVLVAAAARD